MYKVTSNGFFFRHSTLKIIITFQTIQNEEAQVGTHLYAGFDKHFLQKCHYSAASMVQFIFIDPAGKIIELQAPLQSSNMEDFIKETIQD